MYCSSCGNQLSDQAVICPKCGVATANFSKIKDKDDVSTGTIVAFYIAAIIPIIGFIGAIYLFKKGKVTHAIVVAALSIIWLSFNIQLLHHM